MSVEMVHGIIQCNGGTEENPCVAQLEFSSRPAWVRSMVRDKCKANKWIVVIRHKRSTVNHDNHYCPECKSKVD